MNSVWAHSLLQYEPCNQTRVNKPSRLDPKLVHLFRLYSMSTSVCKLALSSPNWAGPEVCLSSDNHSVLNCTPTGPGSRTLKDELVLRWWCMIFVVSKLVGPD